MPSEFSSIAIWLLAKAGPENLCKMKVLKRWVVHNLVILTCKFKDVERYRYIGHKKNSGDKSEFNRAYD